MQAIVETHIYRIKHTHTHIYIYIYICVCVCGMILLSPMPHNFDRMSQINEIIPI